MKVLQDLLGDHPVGSFLDQTFTRVPFAMPDLARPYQKLLDWDVVRKVIDGGRSTLRIIKDGKMVLDDAKVSYDEAREYHRSGNTLLLRYSERSHPELAQLAADFAESFHTPVDIQAYCTPGTNQAFLWHYDVEEVFIIQTQGAKEYTIRPNTVHPDPVLSSIPDDLGYEKEKTPIKLDVTLQAGDWLYIPSGWWHIARTLEESMHLSVGLMPVSNLNLLQFLGDYLSASPAWRARLPLFLDGEAERKHYEALFAALSEDLTRYLKHPAMIGEFLKYLRRSRAQAEKTGKESHGH